ncbi:TIGR01777 family oxidoreductase [Vibrio sp. IRLE0018]|uniref:TIGR01777 family oxidoreductase n=1 Tax=Vibrio floridensis TaxID=2908007 RepID=UPI001A240BA4|nr:TIGR01777 family oxidoreductase [Vibrio floridensis]MCF8778538.1 TIGR01777 family oxidoreductase [Vibrio floridensis]HAS6347886.1 TIGR01777 family protein [Vibrio vulnificus]HAS6350457.1 TIGR01777 family protein [Vibrio vulnificus]
MKILLTGGTGFIGSELLKALSSHHVVLLTRDVDLAKQKLQSTDLGNIRYIADLSAFRDFNDFDAVINLAGEPIADKRWTESQKQRICDSRWQITEQIVALIHASAKPPSVFISGSAVGYYGDQQDHPFDECLHVHSAGFTHTVCAHWEQIAKRAQSESTRVCLLRTGVVLGLNGGALKKMLPPYRFGLGGPLGSGKQFLPWIHLQDMVRAIVFLLETPHAQGVYNLCAPHPVSNREFSQTLAKTLKRPHLLSTPKWLMTLAMGESSCLLFDSIRAKPKRLTEIGFTFLFSRVEPALKNILKENN